MTRKIRASDLPEFDITEHLDSEHAMVEYLTIVLEENDPAALAGALGSIARSMQKKARVLRKSGQVKASSEKVGSCEAARCTSN